MTANDLIYPLFVQEGAENVEVASMPGVLRHTVDSLVREGEAAFTAGELDTAERHFDGAIALRRGTPFADVADEDLTADVAAFLMRGAKDGDEPASCN